MRLSPRTVFNSLDNTVMVSTMLTGDLSTLSGITRTSTNITNALAEVAFAVFLVFPSVLRVSQVVVVVQAGRSGNGFTDGFFTAQADFSADLLLTRAARLGDIVLFFDALTDGTTVVGTGVFDNMFFTFQTLSSRNSQVHVRFTENIIFLLSATAFFRNAFSFRATSVQISRDLTLVSIAQSGRSHTLRTFRADGNGFTRIVRVNNTFASFTALRFTFQTDGFLSPSSTNNVFNTVDQTMVSVNTFNLGTTFEGFRSNLALVGTTGLLDKVVAGASLVEAAGLTFRGGRAAEDGGG
jgi:hypothetical protein